MNLRKLITNPLTICLFLYVAALIWINPLGEYVVNDDWAHTRQVEAFLNKSYRIQANTDAVLILQAVMGYAISLVFGFTLTNLKLLVIILSIFLLVGIYKISRLFELNKALTLILLITVAFNPLYLHLGSVFMTDIPFLAFFTWSLYFYLASLKSNNKKSELMAGIFCGLAVLIRQAGLVPFIAFTIVKVANSLINKKRLEKSFYISTLLVLASFALYIIWPRYSGSGTGNFGSITNLLADSIRLRDVAKQFGSLLSAILYFGFFSFPFIFAVKYKWSMTQKIIGGFLPVLIGYWAYISNIFPSGNVLYLEGLYAKTTRLVEISLLNNNVVKLVLAVMIGTAVAKIVYVLMKAKYKNSLENQFLVLSFLGSLAALLFANDFYDRYLLPAVIVLLVFLARNVEKELSNKYVLTFFVTLYVFISTTLVLDYTHTIKLKWLTAEAITKQTGIKSKIYVDGTYTKYQSAKKTKDFTGLTYINTTENYLCYVDNVKVQNISEIENILNKTNVFLDKILGETQGVKGLKEKTKNINTEEKDKKIFYSQEFYSPVYNLIGKESVIKGWCL